MREFELSWDDLRSLEALERLGTVRAAARETRQSQSTFYRRVAALELGLGRVCLNRRAEEATLTPFGASLAQVGRKVRGGLTEVFSRLRAEEQVIEGVVSLTTVEALVPLLEPALVRLATQHPGLTIELHPGDNGPSVRRREVDVALGIMQRPPDGCWGRRLAVLEAGVFGTAACVKSGRRWVLRGPAELSSPTMNNRARVGVGTRARRRAADLPRAVPRHGLALRGRRRPGADAAAAGRALRAPRGRRAPPVDPPPRPHAVVPHAPRPAPLAARARPLRRARGAVRGMISVTPLTAVAVTSSPWGGSR